MKKTCSAHFQNNGLTKIFGKVVRISTVTLPQSSNLDVFFWCGSVLQFFLQGRSPAFDIQKTIHNAPQMLTEMMFTIIQAARFNYFCLVKRYLLGVLEWNTIKR
jgi:hypothetical protein